MENNEISMCMDVKLDIHSKRPESLKFKVWTRCLVKIEAIKCVPSFLRISLIRLPQLTDHESKVLADHSEFAPTAIDAEPYFSVSINILGVSVSQTESRTKSFSYGLFWKQHRRDCFIYFAIEGENVFKRHMKWVKKSIKNLELHRQLFLEQRRNSRESMRVYALNTPKNSGTTVTNEDIEKQNVFLGPLPKVPDPNTSSFWSPKRVSRVSGIYEEIIDRDSEQSPRLSRRCSRSSIASGIYEEMKPIPTVNFNSIVEEVVSIVADDSPPPVPPLPPPRKRMNTFQTEVGIFGEIPRSNTNPESEIAKKKKYKNMLDTIFGGGGRSKRAVSVSESAACTVGDLLHDNATTYVNSGVHTEEEARHNPHVKADIQVNAQSKRNSFSSPDLSKVNLINNFEDDHIFEFVHNSFANAADIVCDSETDEAHIHCISGDDGNSCEKKNTKDIVTAVASERLSVSDQIPGNFNCSAYNSSSINLIGASGSNQQQSLKKNEILLEDDLTGYCIMAPIAEKNRRTDIQPVLTAKSTQSILSSGYATAGSYCSSTSSSATSSCGNSTEQNRLAWTGATPIEDGATTTSTEESGIYEKMIPGNSSFNTSGRGHGLYENILALKAAQELGGKWEEPLSLTPPTKDSTSTPTLNNDADVGDAEDSFYQTPRRSIVSVDEKIPSYYPNSCDKVGRKSNTLSNKSHSMTPNYAASGAAVEPILTSNRSPCNVISSKLRNDIKENIVISSPDTRSGQSPIGADTNQDRENKASNIRKTAVHKISEHIYNVSHLKKAQKNGGKSNSSVCKADVDIHAKFQRELLQLVALQNIDFKFDETKQIAQTTPKGSITMVPHEESVNCYQTKTNSREFFEKYATIALTTTAKSSGKCGHDAVHLLQQSQQINTQYPQQTNSSPKSQEALGIVPPTCEFSVKKFASLPRFKKFDLSPLRLRINNVLQRNQQQAQEQELA